MNKSDIIKIERFQVTQFQFETFTTLPITYFLVVIKSVLELLSYVMTYYGMSCEHFMTPYCNNVSICSSTNLSKKSNPIKFRLKEFTFLINTRRTSALSNPCDEIPIPPSDSGFTDSL